MQHLMQNHLYSIPTIISSVIFVGIMLWITVSILDVQINNMPTNIGNIADWSVFMVFNK
jgi:hypothetical protein